jgi:hypothetical protein
MHKEIVGKIWIGLALTRSISALLPAEDIRSHRGTKRLPGALVCAIPHECRLCMLLSLNRATPITRIFFFAASAERRISCATGTGCSVTGEAGIAALFSAQEAPLDYVEATLPSFPCHTLWLGGLEADRIYDLELPLPACLCSRNKFARTTRVSFRLYLAPPLFQPPAACGSTLSEDAP